MTTMERDVRQGWISSLLLALALSVLLLASYRFPTQSPVATMHMLPWLLLLGALAVHRPLGGASLGLGSALLPSLLSRIGVAETAILAMLALLLAEFSRRFLESRFAYPPPERRHRLRLLVAASRTSIAVVLGGLLWTQAATASHLERSLLSALAYALLLTTLELSERWARRPRDPLEVGHLLPAVLVDATAWFWGAVLVSYLTDSPWASSVIWVGLAVLGLEAARASMLRDAFLGRMHHLQSVGGAGARLVKPGAKRARLAQSISEEVSAVLPFSWFHFELPCEGGVVRSWRAGPDGLLEEGSPTPGASPPPLPGIHRRAKWRLIDRFLVVEGRQVGRLRLWCDPRRLEPGALELFELLLPQLAASIERSQLDREAKVDGLTGLALRRVLELELEAGYQYACEEGASLAIVLCDLDHFKSINDRYGHAAGDLALQHVASIVMACAREGDLCARYGGEELAILLKNARGAAVMEVAERVRTEVAASPFVSEGEEIQVTLSAGCAVFPEVYVPSAPDLLVLADEALYAAKNAGRNRSVRYSGPDRFAEASGRLLAFRTSPGAA